MPATCPVTARRRTDRAALLSAWLRRLPIAIAALDLAVIVLHLACGRYDLVNLDKEANLPTWYSSAKLLALGALAWWFAVAADGPRRAERRACWYVAAAGFLLLSMDQTAQVHERAGRALMGTAIGDGIRGLALGGDALKDAYGWVVLALPLMLAALYFAVSFFREEFRHDGRTLAWLLAGLALLACSPALETFVYHLPPVDEWTASVLALYERVSGVEQMIEVIGCSCLLFGLLRHLRHMRSGLGRPR